MKRKTPHWASVFLLCLIAFSYSCKDDTVSTGGYDPSKPVVFRDFSPEEGSIRTKFYIYGENFGTDISKIHVSIGGQVAYTIGSSGTEIYCMVPRRAFDGVVKVSIESADGSSEVNYEFEKRFSYVSKTSVGTLCGKVDEQGNAANIDGTFDEAGFVSAEWMLLDTFGVEKYLYVSHPGSCIRKIDLAKEEVSTMITNGQGAFKSMQYMTFDMKGDTIFVIDDNGENNKERMAISFLLRSENFRKAQPYIYDRCGYSVYYHPLNECLYYNTWWKSALQKAVYDPSIKGMAGQEVIPVYEGRDDRSYISGHPSGKFMYILGAQCVFKSKFNATTKEFQTPTIFAGRFNEWGYVDGQGEQARFDTPVQGTFVKNEDYVREGKEDVYDFYLCDRNNHCIRKITPEGFVSTFAGRDSTSSDGQIQGHIDGDLRKEARFNQPMGIVYDEETRTFYIGERDNHRIRTITVE